MDPNPTPFIGQVVCLAGNFAPEGWMYCEGKTISINQYQALFSILGDTYGADFKKNTFSLTDLRDFEPKLKENGLSGPRYVICVNGFYPAKVNES